MSEELTEQAAEPIAEPTKRKRNTLQLEDRAAILEWIKANGKDVSIAPIVQVIDEIRIVFSINITEHNLRSLYRLAGITRGRKVAVEPETPPQVTEQQPTTDHGIIAYVKHIFDTIFNPQPIHRR